MRTLGEFYRDEVLSQPDLVEVELPRGEGEVRIEPEIFGWRLYKGKNYIECSSEIIARYLKVFLDARQSSIKMPKDERYLDELVPKLEKLKAKMDRIINKYAEDFINPYMKEKLLDTVWYKLMKEGYEAEEKLNMDMDEA